MLDRVGATDMSIIYYVREGEPPESIVGEKEILFDDFIKGHGNIGFEFFGQYFPVIEDDNPLNKNPINMVLKVTDDDAKRPPFDKNGYYLLSDISSLD
jgi:hypothetical protein